MNPEHILSLAQTLRASCRVQHLRIPDGVSNLELVRAAEKVGLRSDAKALTEAEARKLVAEVSDSDGAGFFPGVEPKGV